MQEGSADELQVAVQVLAEHLSRGVSDDVAEAAGLKARGRTGEIESIARSLARTVDAYDGPTAREVLGAADLSAWLIEALERR